ncbi:MAG: ribosome biogenesis GTP-binding protein YihA/YsxC [bacterium]|nr:ribosome biogenesis GTP-binding protein YihA/YsxC [bacterium]
MKINNAELKVTAVRRSQYPDTNLPEFLLIGRSNVGKSSFINTLISRKNLARTSSVPGKTQTLNFFLVNHDFYLVDAPGYGYAAVNKEKQKKFGMMIEEYLQKRKELKRVFLLIDFRHKPTEDDLLMYNFLKYYNVPTTIVLTKVDKVQPSKKDKNIKVIKDTLDLVVGDNMVFFSSVSKMGRDAVLKLIEDLIVEEI